MTKLEQEILTAVDPHFEAGDGGYIAKAAAEVCKSYIERAWDKGQEYGDIKAKLANYDDLNLNKSEWLQSEGITESAQPGIVVSNGTTSTE